MTTVLALGAWVVDEGARLVEVVAAGVGVVDGARVQVLDGAEKPSSSLKNLQFFRKTRNQKKKKKKKYIYIYYIKL